MNRYRWADEARYSLTALLLAFVFCKVAGLTDIASWPWWAVLLPLEVPAAVTAVVLIGAGGLYAVDHFIEYLGRRDVEEAERRAQLERRAAPVREAYAAGKVHLSAGSMQAAREAAQLDAAGIRVYRFDYRPDLELHVTGVGKLTLTDASLHELERTRPGASMAELIIGFVHEQLQARQAKP